MRPFKLLLDLLYPPKCPFCGRVLERGEEGWCAACQRDLPWTEPGEGKAVEGCALCLSPLWYRDGVRDGVHRYKFGGGRGHAYGSAVGHDGIGSHPGSNRYEMAGKHEPRRGFTQVGKAVEIDHRHRHSVGRNGIEYLITLPRRAGAEHSRSGECEQHRQK